MLTINVAVLLAVIVLGLLLAPTEFGHSVLGAVQQLVEGIARASH